MARNLSRRRVLTHNDFMRFGGLQPAKTKATKASSTPSPAQVRREVDAVLSGSPLCGCSHNQPEADSTSFACPCGSHCTDPSCVAENRRRRSGLRHRDIKRPKTRRHHEAKPGQTKPKRWVHKDVARRHDVQEAVVRRIYAAVQTAKKQGLYGGYLADLLEREVGRRLIGAEYNVVKEAKEHLEYSPPGGYGGPEPTGSAAEPPRPHGDNSSMRKAAEIRDAAERVIKSVEEHTQRIGTNENRCRERLRHAADELEVAADLYEDAGAKVTAGTLRERARQARGGEYRKMRFYHLRKR